MNEEKWLRCPLCGNTFSPENQACPGCPFAPACGLICCPRCHYPLVKESGTLRFLKKLFARPKVGKEGER